ncbi:protein mono-ADP-ribosyltransferase PARP9 isoform X2 [Lampris incognitus]|uniref:protein mono-ADP-ribosyltransferase PARP9 isoform X2 n=1 Tax=Lampris incognitus TaxID=2546036 RepID=UPI0024B5D0F5|nr:protein mono-ADP-ribosyltransferase PARP9 isoform X2 [Lampris incognitus]
MASRLDVTLSSDSVRIVRQCAPALRKVLSTKFGCMLEIHGVESGMEAGTGPSRKPITPERRFSISLSNTVNVSVWKADLTSFKVDAVVNAANRQLQHYGGLALALSEVGGPEIQKESDSYTKRQGCLKTGEAFCTGAGNLPCVMIIHAVGPNVPMNPTPAIIERAAPELEKAVVSILDIVEKNKLQSVAIPALSSGLFNFPLPKCADIIVKTLKKYYDGKHYSRSVPLKIQLVNHDEPSVTEMKRACHQILDKTPVLYSQAAVHHNKSVAKSPTITIGIANASLTLRRGYIEEQETDVIVNTIAPNFNLSLGEISFAISKKAGSKMQTEIKMANNKFSKHVYITKAYNLRCKQVYHTLCSQKFVDSNGKVLYEAVLDCLCLAVKNKHKSIAFPAIGSGNLGFSKKEVSKLMTTAVGSFAHSHQDKIDVHFVIYPSDADTFEVTSQNLKNSCNVEQTEDFQHSKASAPWITLCSNSVEMTSEARRWLEGLLYNASGSVTVHSNFILHFGEHEFKQLSRESKRNVSIEEFFENGCASITVKGNLAEDVVVARLQLEAMLCDAQKEFVKEEEHAMALESTKKPSYDRKPVDSRHPDFRQREAHFQYDGLKVVKVEKVVNPALEELFELKKKQQKTPGPPQQRYQRISAQFCDMVSHIGFNSVCTPPDDPKYGEGIYFTSTLKRAMTVWRSLPEEEYLYFVEAQVLTGKSTPGQRGLIVPPPVDEDPGILYDSVSGGTDINVIFSGYQALPEYIITCKFGHH